MHWKTDDMAPQDGRVAVVTGANSGVGYETARALARAGARVVLACRNPANAARAMEAIRAETPGASLEFIQIDLADLSSVRAFAAEVAGRHAALDLLINNAGVMAIPRRTTADGFERQFGTNHLGHFALTGLLLESLRRAPGARVVTVSSEAHRAGLIRFEDLHGERRYNPWRAYGQSKLANLLFAYELHRRASGLTSVAAHPGYSATNLQAVGPQMTGSRLDAVLMRASNLIFAQSAEIGALPILYAAVAEVDGCDYIGPDGWLGFRGYPRKVRSAPASYDPALAARLWEVSAEWTGVRYLM